jgi:hypothetical protein
VVVREERGEGSGLPGRVGPKEEEVGRGERRRGSWASGCPWAEREKGKGFEEGFDLFLFFSKTFLNI